MEIGLGSVWPWLTRLALPPILSLSLSPARSLAAALQLRQSLFRSPKIAAAAAIPVIYSPDRRSERASEEEAVRWRGELRRWISAAAVPCLLTIIRGWRMERAVHIPDSSSKKPHLLLTAPKAVNKKLHLLLTASEAVMKKAVKGGQIFMTPPEAVKKKALKGCVNSYNNYI